MRHPRNCLNPRKSNATPGRHMTNKPMHTEFALWSDTLPEQRSFLVEVLHWFHYRPRALKRSWSREEVLTWELIRALELLPQRFFAIPLLAHLAELSPESRAAISPLLTAERVTISRYPSLRLAGTKRNCRSDIGIGLTTSPTVWIEAKTARFKVDALRSQLLQQQSALAAIYPNTPTVLATLLPDAKALDDFPNVSWNSVCTILESGMRSLQATITDSDLTLGYIVLARELTDRIRSHPNRNKGWI